MAIGVPYELYWGSNDPEILREYIEADKIKQQRQCDNAWLFGGYVKQAIESSIGNAFLGKGQKPVVYPEKPIDLLKEKQSAEQAEELKRKEAENERLRLVMLLDRVREERRR